MSRYFLALIVLGYLAAPCSGSIVVTVSEVTVNAGDQFTLDIYASGDSINNFGVEFQITGGTPALTPEFVPINDAASDPTFFSPPGTPVANYVFASDSFDIANSFPLGTASATVAGGPLVDFVGGDATNSGNDASLGSNTLLARLLIQAPSATDSPVADTYNIALVPGANTYFTNANNDTIAIDDTSKLSGTITVEADMAATPEPGSLALAILVASVIGVTTWRRKARGASATRAETVA